MAARGNLAVYLKYSGAHTTRWAGGDKVNWQNFPNRGDQRIRKAIHVRGTGHYIFAPDLSQIECRILNYIAGQNDVIEKFRNHVDPYIGIASDFYGFPVTKDHPLERGTGKQLELSAGYGCGAARCQIVAKLGIYGPPVEISLSEAQRAIDLYRGTHKHVTALWEAGSWVLRLLANGQEMPGWDLVPVRVSDGCVWLPNGAPLIYDTMEWFIDEQNEDRYWRVKTKHGGWTKMYGAKFIENIVQALARVVMSQAMVRLARAGFRPVNTEHDKLVYLIKDDGGKQEAVDYCLREMTRAPDWLPGIPLDAEGQLAETYAA
jgi:DNA polymerase